MVNGLAMCLMRRALGLVTILAAVFSPAVRLVPVRVPDPRGWSNAAVPVGSDELRAIGWSDDLKARHIVAVSAFVDHPTYIRILEVPPAFYESARHIGKTGVTALVDSDALVVRRIPQDLGQGAGKALRKTPGPPVRAPVAWLAEAPTSVTIGGPRVLPRAMGCGTPALRVCGLPHCVAMSAPDVPADLAPATKTTGIMNW